MSDVDKVSTVGKQTLRTSKLTVADLAAKERQIARALGRLKACRDLLETLEVDHVYAFAEKSYNAGIEALQAFSHELEKSLDALDAGDAYGPKTTKINLKNLAEKKRKS